MDAKRVSAEEYMRLRTALFKEYFPELLPEQTADPPDN